MPLTNPLLKTKFFPPPEISDFIERKEVNEVLDGLESTPLLLVSAPTGYGKSTFVSAWLEKAKKNFTWLSLSEQENSFQRFVIYFAYAIQQKNKSFGQEIIDLSTAKDMPSVNELADYFIHHLSNLKEQFLLVLDDYHQIRDREIHAFIAKLLEYPLEHFRLIIITRRDPALPLSDWRSKNVMAEIRASNLRFKQNDIVNFFNVSAKIELEDSALRLIESISDGWISGLRLLLLMLKNKKDVTHELLSSNYKDSHIFQRLLFDVIQKLPENYRDYLMKLSLVEEFNQGLFAVLCLSQDKQNNASEIFHKFIIEVTNSNLFIVALDNKHHWYRFHHLITELLQNRLIESTSKLEIKKIKIDIASWYLSINDKEAALKHLLEAEKYQEAIEVFSDLKNDLLTDSNWQKLETIFNWFPENSTHCYTTLLLAKAWVFIFKGNIPEMLQLIQPIEILMEKENLSTVEKENLKGELHMFKAWDSYNFNMDMEACLYHSNQAIKLINPLNTYALGMSWIFYGGAMQTMEKSDEAKRKIHTKLANGIPNILKTNLYLILCYIDWLNGDLSTLVKTATQMENLAYEMNNKEGIVNSKYFKGIALYFQNRMDDAHKELQEAVKYQHFTILVHGFFSMAALAYTLNELGDENTTKRLIADLDKLALEKGGLYYVNFAKSISSELEWTQNKSQNALTWACETNFNSFLPMSNFTSAPLAQLKILATDNNPYSWQLADTKIDDVVLFLRQTNNTNFLIRVLIVKALVQHKQNLNIEAFSSLKEALVLASKREFIQPFLKMKNELASLFTENKNEIEALNLPQNFLQNISQKDDFSADNLTNREIEILQNMSEKLSNKELGSRLFISESTVKRHIANIFKKLSVSNRREAISIARKMELVN